MKRNRKTSSDKKRSCIGRTLFIIIIFAIGLVIFYYPIISNLLYQKAAKRVIQDYDTKVEKSESVEVKCKLNLYYSYNAYLSRAIKSENSNVSYTEEEMEEGANEYEKMLKANEMIGHINIPKIDLDAPIYEGTSSEVLSKGIGHMEGTSLPVGGEGTHSVLTGHRGLPTAKLFTDLEKVEIGDRFYIKGIEGTIAYEVDQIKVVEPTDFENLKIEQGKDYVTLMTCTPYMINSHRLLVRGHRIDYEEDTMENEIVKSDDKNIYGDLIWATIALFAVLLICIISKCLRNRQKKKNKDKES
ncbi:class C sortase [Clostridium sp. SHJSY1]|uniref:class C sortase n=1 Tax=Clostridium sp. SHJSY1 TaxID=2942483 RepID=UPI00287B6D9F|nr:class C sortase [Clostridium sp. SHJSY1]